MCLDACRTLIQLTCLIVSKAISISSLRGLNFTWFFLEWLCLAWYLRSTIGIENSWVVVGFFFLPPSFFFLYWGLDIPGFFSWKDSFWSLIVNIYIFGWEWGHRAQRGGTVSKILGRNSGVAPLWGGGYWVLLVNKKKYLGEIQESHHSLVLGFFFRQESASGILT